MSNKFARGAARLAARQRDETSEQVHYQVGAASVEMPAVLAATTFDVTDANGILTRVDSRDFLILASDLEIDGQRIEPAAGHRIIVGDLDDGQKYEVASVGGADCWRWSDDYRIRYRIHTKHIGAHP